MSRICSIMPRAAAVLLLAVALVLVGFGHRQGYAPRVAAGQASTISVSGDAALLRLPDGSLPILCLDGSGQTPENAGENCDACRLTTASAQPEAPADFTREAVTLSAHWRPDVPEVPARSLATGPGPRGPPLA